MYTVVVDVESSDEHRHERLLDDDEVDVDGKVLC